MFVEFAEHGLDDVSVYVVALAFEENGKVGGA